MKVSEKRFIELVEAINTGKVARSENDLTRHLANAIEAGGLSCVVDTNPQASRRRPDILGYRERVDADLVLPAELVVEAKKPEELKSADVRDAIVETLWESKTRPYVLANISRIQVFCLTSFVEFGFVRITASLRAAFRKLAENPSDEKTDIALKDQIRQECEVFSLAEVGSAEGADVPRFFGPIRARVRRSLLS